MPFQLKDIRMSVDSYIASVSRTFKELYNQEPRLYRSPGRVNIIGEHTDYNEGFVLPAAINKAMYVAINKLEEPVVRLHSNAYNESLEQPLNNIHISDERWANYVLGVVHEFQKKGHAVRGFCMVFDGDVPIGSGLSSSAALECSTAFALNELFNLNVPREELIFIAQKAEHNFAGVMCGIMDQFASMYGKQDHCTRLDCRSMQYEYIPLQLKGYQILLLNTNVEHSLASSEYNVRRQQCEAGVAAIKQKHPHVKSLRDVDLSMLTEAKLDAETHRRCRYVIEENSRLLAACEDLKNGDLKALGQKMYRTHDGLSKEYNVSCKELDFLVDAVRNNPQVIGARMMGGGFGGCTINIVEEETVAPLVEKLSAAYEREMKLKLSSYVVGLEDGSSRIETAPA